MKNITYLEDKRIQALLRYDILDTPPESGFDDLTLLASQICQTPISIITLLDEKRQWFKSRLGLEISETPRDIAFCAYTILNREVFIVEDAAIHPSFKDNPLVIGDPFIRFYAGAPLITSDGYAIGTISVIDRIPHRLDETQQRALAALGRQVVLLLEMKRNFNKMQQALQAQHDAEEQLRKSKQELEETVLARTRQLFFEASEKASERDVSNALINSLPGIFYLFDQNGKFLKWNQNFLKVTGYSHEEMEHIHPLDFFKYAHEKEYIAEKIKEIFEKGNVFVESYLLTKDGRQIPYLFDGTCIQVNKQNCVCGMAIDITLRKQFEQSLFESQDRYRRLIDLSPNAVYVIKNELCIFTNTAGLELLAADSIDQISQFPFIQFIHPDYQQIVLDRIALIENNHEDAPRIEEKYIRLDGTVIDVEVTATSFIDHGSRARLVIVRDITEAKQNMKQLEWQANYDALTNLANRNLLNDRLSKAIDYANNHNTKAAVIFLDLDNFKVINDTLGHDIGDELLVLVGRCLHDCMKKEDTVARYGGDEFVLVLNDYSNEDDLVLSIKNLIERLTQPFFILQHKLHVTCSIGLSIYPQDGKSIQTLLKNADVAMHQAKAEGRNQYKFYTSSMNDRVKHRFDIETKLRLALENNEFTLHYQPQLNIHSGKIVGIEALIRWYTVSEGCIAPDKFIPIAEETGLIVPIGEWVLEQACKDNKRLQNAGLSQFAVSVNLSARQIHPDNLVESVKSALYRSDLKPEFLKLEVTETAIMTHPDETKLLFEKIKQMGVHFAVDDFGTGYSSLSYLQQYPMDQLKIDKSFIQHIADNPSEGAIAQAAISLGHSLGMMVVAEGVSNFRQFEFLRERSCDAIQGYYFSQALPFQELESMLYANKGIHTFIH